MFLELLKKRRSIRQYQDKKIEQEKKDYLIESVLRSPSSRSINPWEFIVVDERETIEALSKAKPHGATFMKNAPLAIVVCADTKKCDVWVEDCSIASMLIHLAAADLGLGSCWVQLRLRNFDEKTTSSQYVKDILGLPEDIEVEAIIAIGYPSEEKDGHDKDTLLWQRIHQNRYSKK